MQQISTDNLYHHTKLDALKSILMSRGFWYVQKIEGVPYGDKGYKQENFVVCFCDLPIRDSNHIRHRFGPVSIGLRKEWGIRKGVSPVTYIHSTSPSMDHTYIALRNIFRTEEIAKAHNYDFDLSRIQIIQGAALRVYSDLFGNGDPMILDQFKLEHNHLETYAQELKKIANDSSESDAARIGRHTFEALMWVIRLLHNHLETRDSFLRKHEEISESGEVIRVYDEREWRAAFQFREEYEPLPISSNPLVRLKDEHNLAFEDTDISEIVVQSEEQKNELGTFLMSVGRVELLSKIAILPFD